MELNELPDSGRILRKPPSILITLLVLVAAVAGCSSDDPEPVSKAIELQSADFFQALAGQQFKFVLANRNTVAISVDVSRVK